MTIEKFAAGRERVLSECLATLTEIRDNIRRGLQPGADGTDMHFYRDLLHTSARLANEQIKWLKVAGVKVRGDEQP